MTTVILHNIPIASRFDVGKEEKYSSIAHSHNAMSQCYFFIWFKILEHNGTTYDFRNDFSKKCSALTVSAENEFRMEEKRLCIWERLNGCASEDVACATPEWGRSLVSLPSRETYGTWSRERTAIIIADWLTVVRFVVLSTFGHPHFGDHQSPDAVRWSADSCTQHRNETRPKTIVVKFWIAINKPHLVRFTRTKRNRYS